MKAEEIRNLNGTLQEQILQAQSPAGRDAGVQSLQLSLMAEIAAQLAEHNEHMARLEYLVEGVINLNAGGLQVRST